MAHYYEREKNHKDNYITVSNMIDIMVDKFVNRERFKNGMIISSESNAKGYRYLKKSLINFTNKKYRKEFSQYMFRDITEKFLFDYILFERKRGAKNGNNGGIQEKIKHLHATFVCAKQKGVYNVNMIIFSQLKGKMRPTRLLPKTIPHKTMQAIENVDRDLLVKKEGFYLDLFLFSYYAGGMSNIDICFLKRNCIKDDMLIYERIKYDKQVRVVIIDKAKALIEKYRKEAYMDYVFPVIKKRNITEAQMYKRVSRISMCVNQTLRKICEELKIKEKVTWGSARSSFISKMIDEGYHPLQVAELAGNCPQTIYKYYYSNTKKDDMRKDMNEWL